MYSQCFITPLALELESSMTFFAENGPVAVAVPVDGATNQFVVGSGRDILLVTWDGISNVTNPPMRKLASLDTDRNDTRINDGKVDSRGRLWIGLFFLFFSSSNKKKYQTVIN